jgi:CHAT domain-containing protein
MTIRKIVIALLMCATASIVAHGQTNTDNPDQLLKQALRFADLYNWSDAAPLFARAEQIYTSRGDARNTLYAHLGRLRSTMEQLSLPQTSEELGAEIENNPLLKSDDDLRLFCLTVLGDVDGEIDAVPMRRDWEAALKVAQVIGDKKWQNRAQGEIGFSLFLEGDMGTAHSKVSGALIGATILNDAGAQIRYLAAIGQAFVQLGAFDDALGFFDKALKVAASNPDAGYQFLIQQGRLQAFRGKGQLDLAEQVADELIAQARARQRYVKETNALITASTVAVAKKEQSKAIEELEQAIQLAQKGGFTRLLADAQLSLADIYRNSGNLSKAESLAAAAVESTRTSNDIYLLPLRLQTLAELQVSQGKYLDANGTYDRASDILDVMIGNVKSANAKVGLITSMSSIYTEHFALLADHRNDTAKAFSVLEHARGRVTTDLLTSVRPLDTPAEDEIEKQINRLNLELTKANSAEQIRKLREQIFLTEQRRWLIATSDSWKSDPWETIPLERARESVPTSAVMLEYVLAEPHSYCLVINHDSARIATLAGREKIEKLVAVYIKTLKTKAASKTEAAAIDKILFENIPEVAKVQRLIIVPDGRLHLLPFDALVDSNGRYVVESHTITYAPSATGMYLMNSSAPRQRAQQGLLGVGGIPYEHAQELNKLATLRGYTTAPLVNLPASKEEVLAADAAVQSGGNTLLIGANATKSGFEHADLEQHSIIHLAVHGFADEKHPDRAALIFLSDSQSTDDGILEAGEIVRLHTNADLVVLSACDTAVGSLQGEEGIANLSLAFLLSGSKTVVSTLWTIDDTSTLYLMKRFYAHLSEGNTAAFALTAAKRDMLKTYGAQAVPYYWASFRLEGLGDRPVSIKKLIPKH